MATRVLLKKMKPHHGLPLQFLRNPTSIRPRPVSSIAPPEIINEALQLSLNQASAFPLLGMNQKLFAGESSFIGVRNSGFTLGGGAMCASKDDYSEAESDEDWDEQDDVEPYDGYCDKRDDSEISDGSWEEEDEDEDEEPKRKTNRWK